MARNAINSLEVFGVPASPYTRKLIATLRYRRIPHIVHWNYGNLPPEYPKPKVALLPTVYHRSTDGSIGNAKVDTTPIIRDLELSFEGRSVVPADPVLSFLNDLIEDYADEWLTKAMFHYRWAHEKDAQQSRKIIVFQIGTNQPDDSAAKMAEVFAERQINRLSVVGSNDVTSNLIEESFKSFLSIFDMILSETPFLFGDFPSSADFAIYGQLTQLALVDPTPAAITAELYPRVRAWVDLMEDLSGYTTSSEGEACKFQRHTSLKPLLSEIGRTYAPLLMANAEAIQNDQNLVRARIDGREWHQEPYPYQLKCLHVLSETFKGLNEKQQTEIREFLSDIENGDQILRMLA